MTALAVHMLFISTAKSQKVVFSQEYRFKNNPFSSKLMSSYIMEDPVTSEKLIVVSGSKTVTFYLVDENWKLLKNFESDIDKKSGFSDDHFKIQSFARNGDVWTPIVEKFTDFTAETIDFAASKHTVAGKIFQDKQKDIIGKTFVDGNKSYNMYLTKSNAVMLAVIDSKGAITNLPLDLYTQLPLKASKKKSPTELYMAFEEIDTVANQLIQFSHKKVHFYRLPQQFAFGMVDTEPVAEISYFDKQTGKRVKTDLFSVEDLLPTEEKTGKLNNSLLVYDNKVWLLSAYKNGGVLGIFDQASKKLLHTFKYDDKSQKNVFNYGPVLYKTSPGIVSKVSEVKEKVEDVSMEKFCSDVFKQSSGLYVHPYSENEFAVSIGSYQINSVIGTNTISNPASQVYDPSFYESAVAGLVFQKNNFSWIPKQTNFNEANFKEATNKYKSTTKPQSKEFSDAEYKNRKAYVMKEQYNKFKIWTIYYFDGQLKVAERISPVDLSQFNMN